MARRWREPQGYREVLRVSLPLVISMTAHTAMLFTDRLFLGRYSVEALAAATPAGLLAFTFQAFFLGVAGYVNTFVAQYVGAGRPDRVGRALWQGLHFSLAAGLVLAAGALLGGPLFRLAGHAPAVQAMEVTYFRILMVGGVLSVVGDTLACFFSGRGQTGVIMRVKLIGAAVNIPLTYAMINGAWGFPEWGIAGAGLATVASHGLAAILFAAPIFNRSTDKVFGVLRGWRPDRDLFGRLLRFGAPAGAQFFMDLFAITFFLLMVGRLGTAELAATNIAFAVNTLAFMPMMGFSIGTATLVGQSMGAGRPDAAHRATMRALEITFLYMVTVAVLFVVFPGQLLDLFRPRGPEADAFAPVRAAGIVVLRYVAAYTVLDSINVVVSAALKGAGDTRFVGWTIAGCSIFLLVLPVYLAVQVFGGGLHAAWFFITLYVCSVAVLFMARYRHGTWRTLRVIEPAPPPPLLDHPGVPDVDPIA